MAAVLIQAADLYCARVGDAAVAPALNTVVVPGVTALIVQVPVPMFKRADSIASAANAILEYEEQELSEPIAQLVAKLHNNYFSATRLINKLKEYNERTK